MPPRTGWSYGLNTKQYTACEMLAKGEKEWDVLQCVFGLDKSDPPGKKQSATKELHKWMRLSGWNDCFNAIVRDIAYPAYGRAVRRIIAQIDDKNGWLSNKAANDTLTRFGPYINDNDKNELVIRIEGAPEMGSPDE